MRGREESWGEMTGTNIVLAGNDRRVSSGSNALLLPFAVLGTLSPKLFNRAGITLFAQLARAWGWLYLSYVTSLPSRKRCLPGLLPAVSAGAEMKKNRQSINTTTL